MDTDKLFEMMANDRKPLLENFVKHDAAFEVSEAKKTVKACEGIDPGEIDNEEKAIRKLTERPNYDEEEQEPRVKTPDRNEMPNEEEGVDKDLEDGDEPIEDEKQYFAKKEDTFFYMLSSDGEGEEGGSLQIADQDGKVVFDAKDVEGLDGSDIVSFMIEAVRAIEPDDVSADTVLRYLVPAIEDVQKENEEDPMGDDFLDEEPEEEDEEQKEKKPPFESVNEIKVVVDNRDFSVHLMDEGTSGAIIKINGETYEFTESFASNYRDGDHITDDGLRQLAEEVLGSLDKAQFDDLAVQSHHHEKVAAGEEKVDEGWPEDSEKLDNRDDSRETAAKVLYSTSYDNLDDKQKVEISKRLRFAGARESVDESVELDEQNLDEEVVNEINLVTQGVKQLHNTAKAGMKTRDYAAVAAASAALQSIHDALPEPPSEDPREGVEPKEGDSGQEAIDKLTEEEAEPEGDKPTEEVTSQKKSPEEEMTIGDDPAESKVTEKKKVPMCAKCNKAHWPMLGCGGKTTGKKDERPVKGKKDEKPVKGKKGRGSKASKINKAVQKDKKSVKADKVLKKAAKKAKKEGIDPGEITKEESDIKKLTEKK